MNNAKTMNTALFHEPNRVSYESRPIPKAGPGEVVVRIITALTCGTDVKCYRRGHPVLLKNFPSPFGHEFSGIVAEIGELSSSEKPRFQIGDRVVAPNSAPCLNCYYCSKNQHNLCEQLDLLNGAYADYILVPERIVRQNMYRLPDTLSFEHAAFLEPLSVCLHGLSQACIQAGDHVAIMGLGPIGQLMVRSATLMGAEVTAMARSASKLEMAKSFGQAAQTVSLLDYPDMDQIRSRFSPEGRGFDSVIEAIGLPETWENSLKLVRKGGTVNLFGGCPGNTTVTFPTRQLHYDEVKLVSSFHHTPKQVKAAFDLLASGRLDPGPLISREMPMASFEEALQEVEAGKALKIALKN